MDDFLGKPIDFEDFSRVLTRWLPAAHDAAPGLAAPSLPAAAPIDGFDTKIGLATTRGDVAAWHRLLARFADAHRADPARLSTATPVQLRALVHDLKGTAGAIGAVEVCAAIARVEQSPGGTAAQSLAAALRASLAAIDATLAPVRTTPSEANAPPASDELQRALRERLAQRDLSALRYAQAHGAAIRAAFGRDASSLLTHIDQFDFDAALAVLDTRQMPAAVA
jgi:two-component system sensor histidine kinase/response regulator